jgi:hypothetical protein
VLTQVLVKVKEDVTCEVKPIKILDWGEKDLHCNKIFIIRVLWRSSQIKKKTWIRKSKIKQKYPDLFRNSSVLFNFDDEISY